LFFSHHRPQFRNRRLTWHSSISTTGGHSELYRYNSSSMTRKTFQVRGHLWSDKIEISEFAALPDEGLSI
jgi:hypothetical protein